MLPGFNSRFLKKLYGIGCSLFPYAYHLCCSPCITHTLFFPWTPLTSLLSLSISIPTLVLTIVFCFFLNPSTLILQFLPILICPYPISTLLFFIMNSLFPSPVPYFIIPTSPFSPPRCQPAVLSLQTAQTLTQAAQSFGKSLSVPGLSITTAYWRSHCQEKPNPCGNMLVSQWW